MAKRGAKKSGRSPTDEIHVSSYSVGSGSRVFDISKGVVRWLDQKEWILSVE